MRRMRFCLAVVCLLALPVLASAQTKISGELKCAKSDPQHMIAIEPGHSFMISQFKCTWTKAMDIGGMQNKEGFGTGFDEVMGMQSHFHGYFVDTMANGDKVNYRYEGTATIRNGMVQSAEDKWESAAGTGKFKALKSHGTCKGKGTPDGGVTWQCEGEYQLPK